MLHTLVIWGGSPSPGNDFLRRNTVTFMLLRSYLMKIVSMIH